MTRTYELGFVVEPRQNDDEVQAIIDRFSGMIEEAGSQVTHVDNWGKRKLAYPIRKFNEGKYAFLYVSSDEAPPPWPEIERLMQQDEKILRFLTVRTDEDLKRAFRKGKVKPEVPGAETAGEGAGEDGKAEAQPTAESPATESPAAEAAAEAPAADSTEAAAESPATEAAAESPATEAVAEAPAAAEPAIEEDTSGAQAGEDKDGEAG
ncbi:MAG: 30S ribosomal protein S6 [Holophagales bacterium]|nr:30S ribosomal protein S6 [Holophagales bacterium]